MIETPGQLMCYDCGFKGKKIKFDTLKQDGNSIRNLRECPKCKSQNVYMTNKSVIKK